MKAFHPLSMCRNYFLKAFFKILFHCFESGISLFFILFKGFFGTIKACLHRGLFRLKHFDRLSHLNRRRISNLFKRLPPSFIFFFKVVKDLIGNPYKEEKSYRKHNSNSKDNFIFPLKIYLWKGGIVLSF